MLVVAGAVALVLLLTREDDQARPESAGAAPVSSEAPSATAAPQAPTGPEHSEPAEPPVSQPPVSSQPGVPDDQGQPAPGGRATNQELADAVIVAFNGQDGRALRDMVCPSVKDAKEPSIPGDLTAELLDVTEGAGTGKISFRLTSGGQAQDGSFATKQEGGTWCLSGPA
ncbi:hypothetical protein [Qaidamihabitans albus]|uniref:hypothetical protein n=1 Tax=Qaidamihabitans albus TaxID=2795733 RepID=UPI0018F1CE57|nr:hypothetical protein [Qaidamihabitans albus]